MALTWSDGTTHEITYDDLRHACPCANCAPQRNEDDTSMILRRSVEKLPNEKPTVRPVGNYALTHLNGPMGALPEFIGSKEFGDWEKLDPDNGKAYVHGAW